MGVAVPVTEFTVDVPIIGTTIPITDGLVARRDATGVLWFDYRWLTCTARQVENLAHHVDCRRVGRSGTYTMGLIDEPTGLSLGEILDYHKA